MESSLYMSPELLKEVKADLKIQKKANSEIKDVLAIERTIFSNERTFLAYLRTALSMIIVGISMHQFFNTQISTIIAFILIPIGCVIGYIGFRNFSRKRAFIKRKRDSYIPAKQMLAILKAEKAAKSKVDREFVSL